MTSEELKTRRGNKTQEEMAKSLRNTPLSTYRKWEQGARKVPAWVEEALSPRQSLVPGLSMEDIFALDRQARAAGLTMEEYVGRYLSTLARGLPPASGESQPG